MENRRLKPPIPNPALMLPPSFQKRCPPRRGCPLPPGQDAAGQEQRTSQGELPQCVSQCGSRARFFGDLDKGIATFEAPAPTQDLSTDYDTMTATRTTLADWVEPWSESDVYHLADMGNGPQICYILRNRKWQG